MKSTFAMEPNCQYVMLASCVSGSATYFMRPRIDDMNPPTMTPESTIVTFVCRCMSFGIDTVMNTVIRPPMKANT